MRKTILILVMLLMAAFAVQEVQAAPAKPAKQAVQFKSDSVLTATAQSMEKVREKINDALDDTLSAGNIGAIEIGDNDVDMTPEDLKEMSAQWAEVVKMTCYATIAGLLALVLLVLWFRYLNRRNKYRVMEKAIENNYPIESISLNDSSNRAIYVQQPVVAPPMPPQSDQVTVGTPIPGSTPDYPIVTTNVINWRAMMPAVKWLGWGALLLFCGLAIGETNPFTPVGLALMFVGVCKGYIYYKEQKTLQQAWHRRNERMYSSEPMREGFPAPPPMDSYNSDVSAND